MAQYLIYALIDPTTNMIKYIGQSSKGLKRPRAHLEPNKYNRYKSHTYNWIKSLAQKGIKPIIEIIEECQSHELNDLETFYINYFKYIGCPLTNQKPGGRQCRGYSHTLEARTNMSKARLGRFKGKENPAFGRKKTQKQINATVKATSKPVKDQNGIQYSSIADAGRKLNLNKSSISKVANGLRNSVYGWKFTWGELSHF